MPDSDPPFLPLVEAFGNSRTELVEVARRLPAIAGQTLDQLTLSQVGPGLRAAFASYGADHDAAHVIAAQKVWDAFWTYLIEGGFASDSPMKTISRVANGWAKSWGQVRAFFGSNFVRTTVVGAIITLLVFTFEENSKIAASVRQGQADRHRASRVVTVTKTKELIDGLSAISDELLYIPSTEPPAKVAMADLRRRLRNQLTSAEAVLDAWQRDLPILTTRDVANFIVLLNAQVEATNSVAYYLAQPDTTPPERSRLQAELGLVEQGARGITGTEGLQMLDCLIDLADVTESRPCGRRKEDAVAEIETRRNVLGGVADALRLLHARYLPPLRGIDTPEAADFAKELADYARSQAGQDRNTYDPDQFHKLQAALNRVSRTDRLAVSAVPYTTDYMDRLADWFELNGYLSTTAPYCDKDFGPPDAESRGLCVVRESHSSE